MALIKCPECGKEISDKAEFCPNCGCPITLNNNVQTEGSKDSDEKHKNKHESYIRTTVAIACGLFIVIIIALSTILNNSSPNKISNSMLNDGKSSIDIADLYINGTITGNEAYERIKKLSIKVDEAYNDDKFVEMNISNLKNSLGTDNLSLVKESRASLAEKISYKK